MLDDGARTGTIHPVSAKGRVLRQVQHPLQPELLVAEMAGELPPDVARAVRDHLATCESCGQRARALAAPYGVLAALGTVPVAFVPDLRRHVRERWARGRFIGRLARAARRVGGGGIAGVAALVAAALVLSLFLVTNAFQAPVSVGRSTNASGGAGVAGAAGVLYVETDKVFDLPAGGGAAWPAAEVVAVSERTGTVLRSLPATSGGPRVPHAGEVPVALALAPDGRLIYELTAPSPAGQALIAFDAQSGQIAFITPVVLPGGHRLPGGLVARGLAVGPGSARVYLSLDAATPSTTSTPAILVLDQAGADVLQLLSPALPASVAEPPAASGLPGVAPSQPATMLATGGLAQSLAAGGALAVAPDGFSLFDAVLLASAQGPRAVVVRRVSVATGTTVRALALPGDFSIAALAASANPAAPLLYLAQAGHAGQIAVFDTSASGLTLRSSIPVGGPRAPADDVFSGTVAISPTADGTQAYVSADISVTGTQIASHNLWLVDGPTGSVVSQRIEYAQAGQALANWAGGAKGQVFVLRNTEIVLLPLDLALPADPPVWLRLRDGLPMLRLIATASA